MLTISRNATMYMTKIWLHLGSKHRFALSGLISGSVRPANGLKGNDKVLRA